MKERTNKKKGKQANDAILKLEAALPPIDTSTIRDFSPMLEKLIKCLQEDAYPLFDSKYPYMEPPKKKFKEIFGAQNTDLWLLIQDKTGNRAKNLFNKEMTLNKLSSLVTQNGGILSLLRTIKALSDVKV